MLTVVTAVYNTIYNILYNRIYCISCVCTRILLFHIYVVSKFLLYIYIYTTFRMYAYLCNNPYYCAGVGFVPLH